MRIHSSERQHLSPAGANLKHRQPAGCGAAALTTEVAPLALPGGHRSSEALAAGPAIAKRQGRPCRQQPG
jgi:hypothetical protein